MKLGAFFVEILPLLAFFVGYQYFGLLVAAALSVVLGVMVLVLARWRDGRIAAFPLFSVAMSALLIVSSGASAFNAAPPSTVAQTTATRSAVNMAESWKKKVPAAAVDGDDANSDADADAADDDEDDNDDEDEDKEEECAACGGTDTHPGNEIMLCDGDGCDGAWHQLCLRPAVVDAPPGAQRRRGSPCRGPRVVSR